MYRNSQRAVWDEDELYEILSQELSLLIMQYDSQIRGLAEVGTPDLSLISRFYIQQICDHFSSIHSGGHQPPTRSRRQAFGSALDLLACPTTFSSYLNVSLNQDHRRCFALELNFLSNSITDFQRISYRSPYNHQMDKETRNILTLRLSGKEANIQRISAL